MSRYLGQHRKPGVPLVGAKMQKWQLVWALGHPAPTCVTRVCEAAGLASAVNGRDAHYPVSGEEKTHSPFCWRCLTGQKRARALTKPRLLQPPCLHLQKLCPSGHLPSCQSPSGSDEPPGPANARHPGISPFGTYLNFPICKVTYVILKLIFLIR